MSLGADQGPLIEAIGYEEPNKEGAVMERITKTSWPRNRVKSVECRRRDLVIRISNWTKDKHEPAYDVEVYENGIYDFHKSEVFCTKSSNKSNSEARLLAIAFAQAKMNLLK